MLFEKCIDPTTHTWDSSTLCFELSLADFPWSWHTQCHGGVIKT
ncbi:rCG32952 [Rattus norvegicus]|uniref:RCG32952 n=1 Tax=Rattus norvegicus TaxID=10116 RepID=A6HI23_RAT|nr:rCG32952 [Rattus norvegicus]